MRKYVAVFATLAALALLAGCAGGDNEAQPTKVSAQAAASGVVKGGEIMYHLGGRALRCGA